MQHLYKSTLPSHSYALLEKLMTDEVLNDFYLVGGTALSLQINHRESIDIDLFSQKGFPANIIDNYKCEQVINKFNNSIEVIISNTKVMLFNFNYPLNKPLKSIDGIRLADPVDIGLMKLLALQGRTTKKDIIDLHFIDQQVIPLEKLLELFENFYPKETFNAYQSFKSLINKDQIARDPDPKMFESLNWEVAFDNVKEKLASHIKSLLELNGK